jgi:hypothetical protein
MIRAVTAFLDHRALRLIQTHHTASQFPCQDHNELADMLSKPEEQEE